MIVVGPMGVVPTVHLSEVMVLERGVEVFEEVLERDDGLIGQLGEDEAIDTVAHVSESPPRCAGDS